MVLEMSKFYICIFLSIAFLLGCESEIDKCTKAVQRDYLNQNEASARLKCLNAASGKE
jgi:hypothetical protein